MSLTCTAVQSPPRAVRTPRAVRALATPRRLLTPLAWISLMMGRTLAANASAASLRALLDALRAAARRGPPSLTPRRLAAAKAALVRSLIAAGSCSVRKAPPSQQWRRLPGNRLEHWPLRRHYLPPN